MTDNAIAYLETRNALANRDDLARQILAEDEWVFDKRKEHAADGLFRPINRVDGHGVVLDDDLVLPRKSVRRGLDLEFGEVRYQPGGCVRGHRSNPF